ncbi:hypothetical protein ABZW18_23720 [Streptomyces sp. NPDC004647]|uniref:hypothetical protein n=1 Tax=Streptomyces sp. NPDC004647 TaxID=3154671 RepID=UPI0033AFF5AD
MQSTNSDPSAMYPTIGSAVIRLCSALDSESNHGRINQTEVAHPAVDMASKAAEAGNDSPERMVHR